MPTVCIAPSGDDAEDTVNAGTLLAAALLIGFGLVLWVAANWDGISVRARFTIAGGAVLASAVAAMFMPKARVPASLLGVLAIGGLLALFGQTYQTGADPWQLFATWAALALAWVIAARHDAVWLQWVIVVFTALPLWGYAMAGYNWTVMPGVAFPLWAAATAVTVALSPWSPIRPWTGGANWAFRLAAASTAGLVVAGAMPAIFDRDGSTAVLLAGFAVLGLGIVALAQLAPFELGVLSVFVLALDSLLIAGLVRMIISGEHHGGEIGLTLIIGLLSAGIFAGSAAGLLSLARSHGVAVASAQNTREHTGQTWPVTVMTAIGALIAAIPFLVFFFVTFGMFLEKGLGPYILGGAMLAALAAFLPQTRSLGFAQQFGVIALVIGLILLGFGLYRDLSVTTASAAMMLVCSALAGRLSGGWISGLLGALTAGFAANLADTLYGFKFYGAAALLHSQWGWMLAAALGGVALIVRNRDADDPSRNAAWQSFDRFQSGFIAATLVGMIISAGPTFLLGADILGGGHPSSGLAVSLGMPWTLPRFAGVALALAAVVLQLRRTPSLLTPVGLAVAITAIVLASMQPSLGAAIFVLVAALLTGRRTLVYLAGITILWLIGNFYYALGWPLVDKAQIMLALGALLTLAAWYSGARLPTNMPGLGVPVPAAGAIAAVMIGLSAAATAGVVGTGIVQKQHTIQSGRPVFVSLGPVDPRSLMQGDYMALRFALPVEKPVPEVAATPSGTLRAIASIDSRGVATVKYYTTAVPALGADDVAINMVVKNGRWVFGTDAWYFKEGAGSTYQSARFGEFRVDQDGNAVLVGLTDENLHALK